jgi:hypothetical protein
MIADSRHRVGFEKTWGRDDSGDSDGQSRTPPRLTCTAAATLFHHQGDAAASLLTLPLRGVRAGAGESNLVRCLDKLDTAYYEVLAPVFDNDPELKARFTQLVLDTCTLAAQATTGSPAPEQPGTITADGIVD